jgi:alpha-2-macroglobulin
MKKILLIFISALLMISCSDKGDDTKVSDLPEGELLVSNPADYTGLISSYTAGILSRDSMVKVVLAESAAQELSENQLQELFVFEPAVKGITSLADNGTLQFQPETALNSGQFYTVHLNLGKIIEVPEDKKDFSFSFSTIVQDLELLIDRIDPDDSDAVTVMGRIKTADSAEDSDIEKIISIDGEKNSISWEHSRESHSFVLSGIPRVNEASIYKIKWSAKSIAVDREGEESIEVPALNVFNFMSWKKTINSGKTIELHFSMPLDAQQETSGLVRIGNQEIHSLKIQDSRIIIYYERLNISNKELNISSSLQDDKGTALGRNVVFKIPGSQEKPMAEFLTKGGLLPTGERFLIPMEAVSLKAVDIEIIRVYENNMVQYLQDNRDIKGGRNMNRVGQPVAFRTVSLEGRGVDNLNVKNTFELDLTPWVSPEPGALYQLRLSFRRSQSLYPCEESHSEEDDLPLNKSQWVGPSYNSMWDNYYYSDWKNRDSPCSNTYYARRTDNVSFLSSSLGVIAKKSDVSGMTVYITDLNSAGPVTGAEVVLYDYQQQEIARGTSDAAGYIYLSPKGVPFALQASSAGMSSWMRVDDGSSLSVSDFEVEGGDVKEGLKGFIYGERGVWRPGDDIYMGFILQDELNNLPEEHPVIFELLDPDGKRVQKKIATSSVGGMYRFQLKTDEEAPTGFWSARVTVGGSVFTKAIRIETVKPNRLKISLDSPTEPLVSELTLIPMEVKWLHGAVARNMKTETDMILTSRETSFKGYSSFEFDDPGKSFYSPAETVYSGRIDAQGRADIRLPIPFEGKSSGFMNVDLQTKVFEDGGDFSITRNVLSLSPYETYVGIRTPAGDNKRGMLLTDEDHELEIVSLNRDGSLSERKTLEVEMYKLNWKWWWDSSEEDLARFVSRNYRQALIREKVQLDAGKGSWSFQVKYPEWGRYLIRAIDPVSGHSTGKIVFIDWPGWAGSPQRGSSISRLSFYADKEEYKTGEQAVLTIPSEEGGRILISLENATGVLNSWWVSSLSGQTTVEFPIEPSMAPTVYVNASYVQPYVGSSNDLPVRMYGIIPLNVSDPATRLEPVLKSASQFEPQGQVSISISEKQGRPMAYTLAVVDDGLLDLTNFKTPDPWSTFYAKETLGVKTWDIFDDLIAARAGSFGTLLSIGGGEGADPEAPKKASRFEPVVRYFGPFELDAGETAKHDFEMPLYVGSVRIMAVAAAKGSYGHTEKTVPVRSDLMVLGTLPRVLGPDEEILLPVNVFSLSDDAGVARVSVSASGPLEILEQSSQDIVFDSPSDDYVYFKARSKNETGAVRVQFTAEMNGKKAEQQIEFNVRPSNPPTTRVTALVLEPGKDMTIPLQPFGLENQFSQLLEVSSLPPINLEKRLDYLIRYPHGCVEQTVSSVFPQLYLPHLVELSESRFTELEKNIQDGIDRLKRFQLKEGSFSYWSGAINPSPWGTSYAVHFLLEAQKAGYHVPSDMVTDFISYQKTASNLWRPGGNESSLNQAYRLYTLAMAGQADMAGMNRLKDSDALTDAARWKLASAYVLAGRTDAARELTKGAATLISTSFETDSYGTAQRDQALVLEALALMKNRKAGEELFHSLAAKLGSNEWMSTQTTAYTLLSISNWLGEDAGKEHPLFSWSIDTDSKNEIRAESRYSFVDLPPQKGVLRLENKGNNLLYLNLVSSGTPLRGEDRDEESNLNLRVSYKPKNSAEEFASESITSGTDFFMEIKITNPSGQPERENLALEQILPAGWEIINSRLFASEGRSNQGKFDYQDIRDDRIYTYFDLARGETKVFSILLNASYRGKYYQPSIRCSAMYDDTVSAVKAGREVEVR